jgi:malonyl-CoA O-methyltransferase
MSSIARRFSRAAQTYERGAGLHRHVAARLIGMTPDPDDLGSGSILEVGCGTGVLSERIRQRYPQTSLCLLDMADAMVSCVKERWGEAPSLQYVVSDVREFRPDHPFDQVFSSSALHWAVPLEHTFVTLQGMLVPGGGISAAVMIEGTLGELHALRRRVAPGKVPSGRLPTADEVISAVQGAGFTVTAREEEAIQTRYHSADDFLQTIHAQGLTGGPVSRSAVPLSRAELKRLRKEYGVAFRDASGGVYATFVVLYFTAVSPS